MRFDSLIPVLDVRDVEASIDFYSNVLGFRIQDKVQWGGKTEWALMRTGKVQLMLCASRENNDEEPVRSGEGVFFVYLDNIEALRVILGARGYEPQPQGVQAVGNRRDFYLRDPDGYVLWFSHRALEEGEYSQAVDEPFIVTQTPMTPVA